MDRVRDVPVYWSTDHIKPGPSTLWSAVQIRSSERVSTLLIWYVDQAMDGWGASSSVRRRWCEQGRGDAMAKTWVSSSSQHRARKAMRFLRTHSKSREEHVLQTYSRGNGGWKAGGDGVARLVFNGGRGSLRRSFSSEEPLYGGDGAWGKSSGWCSGARGGDSMRQ
jgi:hypothetical protein